LGDRVEKQIFHHEDLKLEMHTEEARRRVPTKEKDPKM
jgi:hypothetical protein